ncbi:transcriptional regulator, AraC family [Verrucomicrobium sp. GAS474]|uniref:AraC family transcriptional regulator n=1 Tax=Verrucomicrobium sp. GAS474 TaxID=1882831 RepID=UPI00087DCFFC|nr:AraC family transcriptional regulator [Verrucomicrobium sp. GAS474]SDT87271.1 transcriptional regulator, AraC family [Verrucomicrobium sp. GAS474]
MEQIKIPAILSPALRKAGIDPVVVLRRAGFSPAFLADGEGMATPEQVVRLWAVIEGMAPDPAFALRLPLMIPPEKHHPASIAAQHARDFRDGLARFARYKLLCCGEEIGVEVRRGECLVSFDWPQIPGPLPPFFVDVVFSSTLELGRRGTRRDLRPLRVELARRRLPGGGHEAHYGCPVRWGARRNLLVFRAADLDLPFATYNAELLAMLGPQLEAELARRKSVRTVSEKVKWVVARSLEKGRVDMADIAREIGLGSRTLQRRIAEEGTTFRRLVDETRRELARRYLGQPSLALGEAAFLLGYEDPNSFFRAFSRWEGRTPGDWRAAQEA